MKRTFNYIIAKLLYKVYLFTGYKKSLNIAHKISQKL